MQNSADGGSAGSPAGWVYLASAGRGLLKAGRSRNAPRGAARDWKPNVIAYARVDDRYAAEALLLKVLTPHRMVGTRLYRLGPAQAMALMREHFGEVVVVSAAGR